MRESLVSLKREESGLQRQYLQSPTPPPPTPHVLVPKNTFTDVKFYWCNWQYLWHASTTSERTFSALRWLKNYQRSTMKQDRLNNCPLMRCHKSITDTLDTLKIACVNKQRKRYFGKFDWGYRYGWVEDETPPIPRFSKRPAASGVASLSSQRISAILSRVCNVNFCRIQWMSIYPDPRDPGISFLFKKPRVWMHPHLPMQHKKWWDQSRDRIKGKVNVEIKALIIF